MLENATQLTQDFLNNNTTLSLDPLPPALQGVKFDEYYFITCNMIRRHNVLKPSFEQIESFLLRGLLSTPIGSIHSPIASAEGRKHIFRLAQARQLEYDVINGRGAMLREEDTQVTSDCKDAITLLDSIGLIVEALPLGGF